MKWGYIAGIAASVVLMTLLEWPRLRQAKLRAAYLLLAISGFTLSVLLLAFPEMPGPTAWIEAVFRPVGRLLE
ncbi:hypothetical protein ACFFK0_21300 [Paenibacillus chartarius]|uniref:Uncharacterized protein n=1 Tax=Paenibacillus chartarius TaxID=747481 RepID=A0ABV6DQL9_9BACL